MFRRMKIKSRLILVLSGLVGLMLLLGGMGIYVSYHSVNMLRNTTGRDKASENSVIQVRLHMEIIHTQLLSALQHNTALAISKMHDNTVSKHLNAIAKNTQEMKEYFDHYAPGVTDPGEKQLLDDWVADTDNLVQDQINTAVNMIQNGQWDEVQKQVLPKINPMYAASEKDSAALTAYLEKREAAAVVVVKDSIDNMMYAMIGLIVLAVVVTAFTGWQLVRAITVPLGLAAEHARRVAAGDLSSQVAVTEQNEFGELQRAFSDMNSSLTRIVSEVRNGTESIVSASSQIAAGNMDLSNRTESQASSLEETASAMEELTTTVKQNADNARQANDLANKASEVAARGGQVVSEVVTTMGGINDSARKIADIIGVIDGIAFQTNILALNAAVEAARAGEQGRGFAVVAAEVRSLAQRSANAAKEIKLLIDDSVGKVETGNRQVEQAGTTMGEVVASIQRVAEIMGEITSASREQSVGIEQVNMAITQMDESTQQNAALVEQAAAAAKSLQDQATLLEGLVRRFKLAGTYERPVANRAKAALGKPGVAAGAGRQRLQQPSRQPVASRLVAASRPVALEQHDDRNEDWEEF